MEKTHIYTTQPSTSNRLVALLAQPEKIDEDTGDVLLPSGLHVIFLPYADDIRDLKHAIVAEPSEEQVWGITKQITQTQQTLNPSPQIHKAKRMVRSLTIKFDSREFPNPHIQRHYDMLHALALEREALDEPRDLICPDLEGMERAREKVIAFRDAVWTFLFLLVFCSYYSNYYYHFRLLGIRMRLHHQQKKGREQKLRERKREFRRHQRRKLQQKKIKSTQAILIGGICRRLRFVFLVTNLLFYHNNSSPFKLFFQMTRLTVPVLKCFLVEMGHPFSKSLKKAQLVEEVANFIRMQKESFGMTQEN